MHSGTAVTVSILFLWLPGSSLGAQHHSEQSVSAPAGVNREEISIVQQDGGQVSIPAQKSAWAVFNPPFGERYFRMAVPAIDLPAVNTPASIATPFARRDLAGGTLFIVKLDKHKSDLSFRGDIGGQNEPNKKYVVVKTANLKVDDKGRIVVYTMDRQLKAVSMLSLCPTTSTCGRLRFVDHCEHSQRR